MPHVWEISFLVCKRQHETAPNNQQVAGKLFNVFDQDYKGQLSLF